MDGKGNSAVSIALIIGMNEYATRYSLILEIRYMPDTDYQIQLGFINHEEKIQLSISLILYFEG